MTREVGNSYTYQDERLKYCVCTRGSNTRATRNRSEAMSATQVAIGQQATGTTRNNRLRRVTNHEHVPLRTTATVRRGTCSWLVTRWRRLLRVLSVAKMAARRGREARYVMKGRIPLPPLSAKPLDRSLLTTPQLAEGMPKIFGQPNEALCVIHVVVMEHVCVCLGTYGTVLSGRYISEALLFNGMFIFYL